MKKSKNQVISFSSIFLHVFIGTLLLYSLMNVSICYSGEPVPYTKEAYDKIDKAGKEIKLPKIKQDATNEEKYRLAIDIHREAFRKAGYDFDASIRKIAKDLQSNRNPIPKNEITSFNMVIVSLHFMKSQCDYDKVDYLVFFDKETAIAVQYILSHTEFKL